MYLVKLVWLLGPAKALESRHRIAIGRLTEVRHELE